MRRSAVWALLLQGCFYISADEYRDRWDLDGDGVERPRDCDDGDASIQVPLWYVDADEDGVGGVETAEGCAQPDGAVATTGDCDDDDPARHPGRAEVCNGVDDDCDDDVDEDASPGTWYPDADEDGYGDASAPVSACDAPAGHVDNADDCDDDAQAVNPGAAEVACNGVDDDCDDDVDLDDADVTTLDAYTWTEDADGDGWGAEDGSAVIACDPPSGHGPAGDCDDDDPDVNPGADEVCTVLGDVPVDEDCDGSKDGGAVDAPTWYLDADQDGFGDAAYPLDACAQPGAYVSGIWTDTHVDNSFDCDDGDADVNPAALEICNGISDNCGPVDQNCVTDTGDTGN